MNDVIRSRQTPFEFKEWNPQAIGYTPITGFYQDFGIAEFFGYDGIQETYDNALENWFNNTAYFTEFVMVLNWKVFEWQNIDKELSQFYNKLWTQAYTKVENEWTEKQLKYYYSVIN